LGLDLVEVTAMVPVMVTAMVPVMVTVLVMVMVDSRDDPV